MVHPTLWPKISNGPAQCGHGAAEAEGAKVINTFEPGSGLILYKLQPIKLV
jgi:hypothetical protein